jgi:preprotein translocase subunit SecY
MNKKIDLFRFETMAEEKKSHLFMLKPLIERWPAVAKPEGHVTFRTKIMWTA